MPDICTIRLLKLTAVKNALDCAVKKMMITTMPEDHRQAADVAGLQPLDVAPCSGADAVELLGRDDRLGRRIGNRTHVVSSPVPAMPATFVAVPPVMAETISCCVVFSTS